MARSKRKHSTVTLTIDVPKAVSRKLPARVNYRCAAQLWRTGQNNTCAPSDDQAKSDRQTESNRPVTSGATQEKKIIRDVPTWDGEYLFARSHGTIAGA